MEMRWQNSQHHFGRGWKQPERRYHPDVIIDDKSILQKLKISSTAFKAPYTQVSPGATPIQPSLVDENKKPLQADVIEVGLDEMQEIRKHTENGVGPCVMVGGEPKRVTLVRDFKAAVKKAAGE